ncbi:lytic transglycosylase domain-containing protein [Aeromonas veronii]|uniref:transglycosylase SLT domain-containing protein n=1 Tax=Aeromonas veronii TaxID=654 RepID=UPI002363C7FD|nr:transglycosylase SLT domain-containing protein [Aeromonas veronii]MDD1845773.1 lytic transglycosylase domain-containing protein [Aeromonas veronii]
MTDDSRIERAEIGNARIENLDVGSMNLGAATRHLADITVELEQQGRKSQSLLKQVLLEQNKIKSKAHKGSTQETNAPKSGARNDKTGSRESKSGANKNKAGHGGLHFVDSPAPKIEQSGANSTKSRPRESNFGTNNASFGSDGGAGDLREKKERYTERARKNRTIELPDVLSASAKTGGDTPKAAGFYLGDDGRVRRPDGKFASKVEVRRFNGDQGGGDSAPGEKYQHSLPALMVRTVGALMKLTGKPGASGGQAGDVAGVAAGGSMFLAVKEMATIASDTKEALKERGLTGVGGIAPYLKSQFGQMASRNPLAGGEKRRQPKAFAQGEQAKSAIASQQDKQVAQSKAVAERQSKQSETQHDELLKKLDEVADELKPKGPGMLDSALDLAGDMFGRKKGGRGRRSRGRARRLSGGDFEPRTRGSARTRPAPRPRAPEPPRGEGKLARVRATMGRGMGAMPSVASAAGRTGGAIAKRGAAMGGAAVGRMAGMGARAIPVVGQALALGLAAYDGYDGYNDKEGQARAFDLKDGKEATTGQKSAMAAAKVLDLGGLTSGAAGLLGTAAGAMGFNKLQEALTFDPDDMARAIYEGMTIFDRKKPKDRGGSDTTINNITTNNNSGITPRGVTDATGGWKGTPLKFNGAEAESGLPSGYLAATAAVESGGNWNAVNKDSGAMGGWQFMPKTAAGLGLSMQDAFDPAKSTKAMIEHTKQNQAYFEKTMGRSPEGRELYLMHQQGMGGGTKLLKNPNALAADVLNSKDVNGMKAVLQNGGRADMTAQEFVDMVLAKYDKAEAYNKANPGKAIDLDALAGTKPKYEAPAMLRGGPKPGEVASSLIPPAALAANATANSLAAPVSLKPVSDIQATVSKNEMKGQDKKPYAPGADPNAGMLTVLKSMDKTLKDMSKKEAPRAPSGGPLRSGGKPQVSGHPTMSGPMADFANDRR